MGNKQPGLNRKRRYRRGGRRRRVSRNPSLTFGSSRQADKRMDGMARSISGGHTGLRRDRERERREPARQPFVLLYKRRREKAHFSLFLFFPFFCGLSVQTLTTFYRFPSFVLRPSPFLLPPSLNPSSSSFPFPITPQSNLSGVPLLVFTH
ncbi:MAG: hypothetical protein J3R72DRAFT_19207 [Linnemannia gamsii]|nr:MAG: hypothetical protein J3R72DRAFT_19207 [Linnemannia gamsii]